MPKKILLLLAFIYMACPALLAQLTAPEKEYTAFNMRHNGKIYVVVSVILIILLGLIVYLVRIDRKIAALEKENK